MLISIPFSLKVVSVEGVSLVVNSEEAQRIKNKYPSAKIKGLRRKGSKKPLHGPVCSVSLGEYYETQMGN